jgi:hypothetical protein
MLANAIHGFGTAPEMADDSRGADMSTRDLLLVLGVLRSGQMFPSAVMQSSLSAERSLKFAHALLEE